MRLFSVFSGEKMKLGLYYKLFYANFGKLDNKKDITYDNLISNIIEKLKEIKNEGKYFEAQEIKFNAKINDIERHDLSKYSLAVLLFLAGLVTGKLNLPTNSILEHSKIIIVGFVVLMLIDDFFYNRIKLKKSFYRMCLDGFKYVKETDIK